MMIANEFIKSCWKYYLALEEDFLKIERYISFENDNFDIYSIELSKQYQAICSEVDVVCKIYCKELNANSNADNILDYGKEILGVIPDIKDAVVETVFNGIVLEPLRDWSINPNNPTASNDPLNQSPNWWKMYNKVKHHRLDLDSSGKPYYKQANLDNTMNALAGLFVLCMRCYRKICTQERQTITIPLPQSKLFTYKDWDTSIIFGGNVLMTIE